MEGWSGAMSKEGWQNGGRAAFLSGIAEGGANGAALCPMAPIESENADSGPFY